MADWESQIAGIRMVVDQEFADRVQSSSLSSQQWNVVMMAVSFEIENPDTPDDARLVADTSKLANVMEEIKRVGEQMPAGGGAGGDGGDGGDSDRGGDGLIGGVLGGVLSSLGGGGSSNDEIKNEATQLADAYADRLQAKLVERGRWESICGQAASA